MASDRIRDLDAGREVVTCRAIFKEGWRPRVTARGRLR
jgi:hypothetical protein